MAEMVADRQQRVVVVDDDEDVAALVEALVEVDDRFAIVGVAATVGEGLALVAGLVPDVVTLDLDLAGHRGIEALAALRTEVSCPIIVFSSFPDPLTLLEVIRHGGSGYVDKARAWADLLPTMATVCGAVAVSD